MRRVPLFWLAALVLLSGPLPAPRAAHAQSTLPPCPIPMPAPVTLGLQPPQPCEGRPLDLVVHYFPCCTELVSADPPDSTHGVRIQLIHDFRRCESVRCLSDSVVVPLGLFAAGHYFLKVEFSTEWRSDSGACVSNTSQDLFFDVTRDCTGSGTGIPYIDGVLIGRADQQACPGDSIPVRLFGTLPDDCTKFERIEVIPSPILTLGGIVQAPPLIRAVFSHIPCLERLCVMYPQPWSATVRIGPLEPRGYQLPVDAIDLAVGCGEPPDTTFLGMKPFPFTVLDSCEGPPPVGCLLPSWITGPMRTDHCDAFIDRTHDAQLTLGLGTSTPLAALQGTITMLPPGLQISQVEAVGPASGMHLSWNHTPDGMKFVLFAEQGAPIPGGTLPPYLRVPILRITFSADPVDPGAPRTRVFVPAMLGADEAGQAVSFCPTFAALDVSAYICRIAPCDFNGDGIADVRDLVRMVRCITKVDTCVDEVTRAFDCDGSGTFDIDDVICCAMAILREDPHPPGQDDRPANLQVSMGEPETVGGALEIPVNVTGDTPVGAARFALRLPASAFQSVSASAEPGASWLVVHDVQSDEVTVGMIALGTGGPPQTPLRFTLRLEPRPGTSPSGQVSLVGADFAAPDGARLLTDPGSPSVTFGVGPRLDLSAAQPNPFREAMRFSVMVPRAADVEVGIFDLVGRRLATLHRGPIEAGAHEFTWNGRTDDGTRAPSGVYFYHVRSNGHVLARRAVFLGGTAGP